MIESPEVPSDVGSDPTFVQEREAGMDEKSAVIGPARSCDRCDWGRDVVPSGGGTVLLPSSHSAWGRTRQVLCLTDGFATSVC